MTLPKPRRLSYTVWGEGEGPQAGDLIRCRNRRTGKHTGTEYAVLRCKLVKTLPNGDRKLALVVVRVDDDWAWPDETRCFDLWWLPTYRRKGSPLHPYEARKSRGHMPQNA